MGITTWTPVLPLDLIVTSSISSTWIKRKRERPGKNNRISFCRSGMMKTLLIGAVMTKCRIRDSMITPRRILILKIWPPNGREENPMASLKTNKVNQKWSMTKITCQCYNGAKFNNLAIKSCQCNRENNARKYSWKNASFSTFHPS